MMKVLLVVDWQRDFVYGSLGTPEAQAIRSHIEKKVTDGDYDAVLFTKDTHYAETYAETTEGQRLPAHVIKGTKGHDIVNEVTLIERAVANCGRAAIVEKNTFGEKEIAKILNNHFGVNHYKDEALTFEFVGVCTDICVISNLALIKAHYPDAHYIVDSLGCAGATPEAHNAALTVFNSWGVEVIR